VRGETEPVRERGTEGGRESETKRKRERERDSFADEGWLKKRNLSAHTIPRPMRDADTGRESETKRERKSLPQRENLSKSTHTASSDFL